MAASIQEVFGACPVLPCRVDDLRAGYVVDHADRHSHEVEHRRMSYDPEEFLRIVATSGHPEAGYVASFQLGEQARFTAER